MLKIISYNKKTILSNLIELKICKRFYPKNPIEKVMEKVVQECIGAGCASTRPYLPSKTQENTKDTKVSTSPNINTTMAIDSKLPTLEASEENKTNTRQENKIRKDIAKPIETIAEKYTENNNYSTSTTSSTTSEIENYNRRVQQINRNYEDNTVTHNLESTAINHESTLVSEPSSLLEQLAAKVLGDTMLADIKPAVIPPPPPLPKVSPYAPINVENQKPFAEELQEKVQQREKRIKHNLNELQERKLIIYQDNEEKTTPELHKLLLNEYTEKKQITFDYSKEYTFEVGMLQVSNLESTILLDGKQKHIVVMCILQDNQRIVFGMLTSSKNDTIILSEKQPFAFDSNNNNKQQRLSIFTQPLLVENKAHFKSLDVHMLDDGNIINQQKTGQDYLNSPEIKDKLYEQINTKVIPQINKDLGFVYVYSGKGITNEDIEEVLDKHELIMEKKAEDLLQDYKKVKNQLNSKNLMKWFKNTETTVDKKTFKLLQEKIETYENKFK